MLSEEIIDIIREEESVLLSALKSLSGQLTQERSRFRIEEERSRELTAALVSTRRAEDRQLLASDEGVSHGLKERTGETISVLEKMLEKPYFARVVYEEESPSGEPVTRQILVGHHANGMARIVDWKDSPLARLYYLYAEDDDFLEIIQGKERTGIILHRRQITIEDGQLKKISGRFGEVVRRDGEWIKSTQKSGREQASSYDRLPDVMSLITPHQFRAITEESESPVVLMGIAGSGKTTVALYRLASILQQNANAMRQERCAVIVRHALGKLYISNSLNQLGLSNVKVLEQSEWSSSFQGNQFDHLIIDEAQDATPEEIQGYFRSVKKPNNLTFVGDRRQMFVDRSEAALTALTSSHVVQFEIGHRSSLPIMKFASHITNEPAPQYGRPGRIPNWFHCGNQVRGVRTSKEWIERILDRSAREVIGVVCRNAQLAAEAYEQLFPLIEDASVRLFDAINPSLEPGVLVVPVHEVRGLEFRNVLLWNPSVEAYTSNAVDRRTLYVAVTRAESDLCIVTWDRPTVLLPGKDSGLVRYLDLGL